MGEQKHTPREPTEAMLAAYNGALNKLICDLPLQEKLKSRKRIGGLRIEVRTKATIRWQAMWAAAPDANDDLYGALEFYADAARWKPNSYGIISAHDDAGDRARAALSKASGRAPTNKES